MEFKLLIKDYDSSNLLFHKQIQIINTDTKESFIQTTNANGEVVFNIEESQKGDFFHILLVNDNDYKANPYYLAKESVIKEQGQTHTKQITQKILTPNNYFNHPAVLYFAKKRNGNIIIGVLKAYKINDDFITMNNSLKSFINEWQDEVFTIDDEQTLRIQAFLYDFDKDDNEKEKKESTDKNKTTYYRRNLLEDTKIKPKDLDDIQWYYQILDTDVSTSLNVNQIAKNLTFIKEQKGTNIHFNLSMLKENERIKAKRIRIFAYVGEENEVMYANSINLATNKTQIKSNRIERIYCVELKIVRTRFSLLFDGENLGFYENERLINHNDKNCLWNARSGKAIHNIQVKNDKSLQVMQDRLRIQHNETQSFHYDTKFQKQESDNHQVIEESEKCFFVKLQSFSETSLSIYKNEECTEILGEINNKDFSLENKNINLNGKFLDFIQTLKNVLEQAHIDLSKQNFILPLRVEYKKRIIIHINRNSQTTQSTKAEFSMSIDNQNWNFKDSNNRTTNTAYILERPSPDCITPNLELRIPEGRYNVDWNISQEKFKNHTLKLYNDYITKGRAILIHSGKYPQNSQGCLLLEEKTGKDNELKRAKSVIEKLREEFASKDFKDKFGNMPNAASHIMVIVKNEFERKKEIQKYPILSKADDRKRSIIDNTPAIFNIEGYESGSLGDVKNFLKRNLASPNFLEEVNENEPFISMYSQKYNIDSNLVRAIIFLESTHGYYDKAYDVPIIQNILTKYHGRQKSFTPMNVNYDYWEELATKMGYTREEIKNNPGANLDMGCLILRRIIDRLEYPTIEKIGTLYNVLGKEKISDYGKNLQIYYNDEAWYGILDYIKDNPPSIKGF